jgi:hypothetical protein
MGTNYSLPVNRLILRTSIPSGTKQAAEKDLISEDSPQKHTSVAKSHR